MRKQKLGQVRALRNFSISQLELLHTHYHWARDRVLRKHGLRHVHLAMVRLIRVREPLSLAGLRIITGYSRSAMNKHRDYLVERKLIRELPRTGDRRVVRLGCTGQGKRKLEDIDAAIEAEFMKAVGFTWRTQLKAFAVKLEEAFRDFPGETISASWVYSVKADNKLLEEQLFVPSVLPAGVSPAAIDQEAPSLQGKASSSPSQTDFDPDLPW
jgi:DNA-binding MarR family transcriptional regulator